MGREKVHNSVSKNDTSSNRLPLDGVDRDSGGESGHGARAGRDTETKWHPRLEPGVPIHPV